MSLTQGFRVGVYEIEMLIGVGGMGEVYRARDTQLGRPVAIKVLPDTFANDPERRARFEREAKTLAALNHPNIAVIHGFESSNGTHALVMEFVEGPTLADRIAEGPMPLDEALPIARQVAVALEAAHEQGIIHRDLKPANIKVRPDGTVKVLDFGLAKVLLPSSGKVADGGPPPAATAQTTAAGIVLGTPAYMAPEQARGRAVDKRADIWSFGCIVYELVTGRRLFTGESTTDTLAAVLNSEPDLRALPGRMPPAVRMMLARCLRRDPIKRLRDIGDFRIELEDVRESDSSNGNQARRRAASPLGIAAAMVAIAVLSALASTLLTGGVSPATSLAEPRPTRRTVMPLSGVADTRGGAVIPTLSADGSLMVYTTSMRGTPGQLHVRRLDALDSHPVHGTDGAALSFLSHDAKRIGFEREGQIWYVPIEGGVATRVTHSVSPDSKPAWLADGRMVYTSSTGELRIVRPGETTSQPLTRPQAGEKHLVPVALPNSDGVLFTAIGASANEARIDIVSIEDGTVRTIVDAVATTPQLAGNFLLYARPDGTLVAVQFDLRNGTAIGGAVALPDRVSVTRFGIAQYAAAPGVIAYFGAARNRLVEIDRQGRHDSLSVEERSWHHPRYSPDGSRIVADLQTAGGTDRDVWVFHRATSTLSRVTRIGDAHDPTWLPDGQHVSFFSFSAPGGPFMIASADGGSEPRAVPIVNGFPPRNLVNPGGWLPDGSAFIGGVTSAAGKSDLWRIPRKGEPPTLLVGSGFDEMAGTVPNHGRWLAYQGNETGRMEIYVRSLDGGTARVQVSNAGGTDPVWDPSANVVYYIQTQGDRRDLIAAGLRMQPLGVVRRDVIAQDIRIAQANNHANYDVHPDGLRFVMPIVATAPNLVTVFDWTAAVSR